MEENKDKGHLIAVYGTLRQGQGNNRLLHSSEHVGTFKTKSRMKMYTTSAGRQRGIPFVTNNEKLSHITVDLYKVDDFTLRSLDNLEGYNPNTGLGWYVRRPVTLVDDDRTEIEAEMYYNESKTVYTVYNGDFCDPEFKSDEEE